MIDKQNPNSGGSARAQKNIRGKESSPAIIPTTSFTTYLILCPIPTNTQCVIVHVNVRKNTNANSGL